MEKLNQEKLFTETTKKKVKSKIVREPVKTNKFIPKELATYWRMKFRQPQEVGFFQSTVSEPELGR